MAAHPVPAFADLHLLTVLAETRSYTQAARRLGISKASVSVRIAELGHEAGAIVGFDLAHAVGNMPLQLHDWNADFAVWCHYKYLNSGPGAVAGCFVHERHVRDASVPKLSGWWGTEPAVRFRMDPDITAPASADAWQLSNPPIMALAPVLASLEIFDRVGMDALRARSERLIHPATTHAKNPAMTMCESTTSIFTSGKVKNDPKIGSACASRSVKTRRIGTVITTARPIRRTFPPLVGRSAVCNSASRSTSGTTPVATSRPVPNAARIRSRTRAKARPGTGMASMLMASSTSAVSMARTSKTWSMAASRHDSPAADSTATASQTPLSRDSRLSL